MPVPPCSLRIPHPCPAQPLLSHVPPAWRPPPPHMPVTPSSHCQLLRPPVLPGWRALLGLCYHKWNEIRVGGWAVLLCLLQRTLAVGRVSAQTNREVGGSGGGGEQREVAGKRKGIAERIGSRGVAAAAWAPTGGPGALRGSALSARSDSAGAGRPAGGAPQPPIDRRRWQRSAQAPPVVHA